MEGLKKYVVTGGDRQHRADIIRAMHEYVYPYSKSNKFNDHTSLYLISNIGEPADISKQLKWEREIPSSADISIQDEGLYEKIAALESMGTPLKLNGEVGSREYLTAFVVGGYESDAISFRLVELYSRIRCPLVFVDGNASDVAGSILYSLAPEVLIDSQREKWKKAKSFEMGLVSGF